MNTVTMYGNKEYSEVYFPLYIPGNNEFAKLRDSRNSFDVMFGNSNIFLEFPLIIEPDYGNKEKIYEGEIIASSNTSVYNIMNLEDICFKIPNHMVEKLCLGKYKYSVALVQPEYEFHKQDIDYFIKNGIYTVSDPDKMINTPFFFILMKDDHAISYKEIEDDFNNLPKRKDYISWDEYFMGIAHLSSMRSKDPKTQVGACIVSQDNKILSIGYNGFPIGCSDNIFPWNEDSENKLEIKDYYVVHAELNAILNYKGDLTGSKLYVLLFPCNECAKAIIQAGIKEVIYKNDKDSTKTEAAKRMLKAAGVKYTQYQPTKRKEVFEF